MGLMKTDLLQQCFHGVVYDPDPLRYLGLEKRTFAAVDQNELIAELSSVLECQMATVTLVIK